MLFNNKFKVVLFFFLAFMFFREAYGSNMLNIKWDYQEELNNHYRIKIVKFIQNDETACSDTCYKYSIDNYLLFKSEENYSYIFQIQSVNSYGIYSEYSEKITINPVYSNVNSSQNDIQQQVDLYQNQPNPFNPSTVINYYISKKTTVNVSVYNISGQKITEIQNGIEDAGYHSVVWNASGMPSGTYFYTLKTDNLCKTKKMLLIK